jgi:hypothetical protein
VIKIRIDFDDDRYIGHCRIQLLELIGQHGSITRAAKAMEMSYKRAWYCDVRMSRYWCLSTPALPTRAIASPRGSMTAAIRKFPALRSKWTKGLGDFLVFEH